RRPPPTLFPYPTLFRSAGRGTGGQPRRPAHAGTDRENAPRLPLRRIRPAREGTGHPGAQPERPAAVRRRGTADPVRLVHLGAEGLTPGRSGRAWPGAGRIRLRPGQEIGDRGRLRERREVAARRLLDLDADPFGDHPTL